MKETIHATCLDIAGHGVLLLGPPGSGKSDLALRLIDEPGFGTSESPMRGRLISDDQVIITREEDRLVASAPSTIRGKLEVRGLGIVALVTLPSVPLLLVVRLQTHSAIERLPDQSTFEILGLALPLVEIDGNSPSAPARLRAALHWLKQPNRGQ